MMNAIFNDAHVTASLAWLQRLEAQLWTLDGFDSHVKDWQAQLPKNCEQKEYEDAFVVFEEIDKLLEQRERFFFYYENSDSFLEVEAAIRLIAQIDEKVGNLYQSIGLGPDGKTLSAPVSAQVIDLSMATKGRKTHKRNPLKQGKPHGTD